MYVVSAAQVFAGSVDTGGRGDQGAKEGALLQERGLGGFETMSCSTQEGQLGRARDEGPTVTLRQHGLKVM